MLVVSRKLKEKVQIPSLNVSVQVVDIKAGAVRLGIEAPPEATVLREGLPDRAAEWGPPDTPPAGEGGAALTRQVRARLRDAAVGLGLLQLQLEAGLLSDARTTLAGLRDDLQLLRLGVEGEMEQAGPAPWGTDFPAREGALCEA